MVMDQFGIDFEQGEHRIVSEFPLPLHSSEIVLFTGESGSGKSTLLRATQRQLLHLEQSVLSLDELNWGEGSLVDLMAGEFQQSLSLLAMCGLGEAQLLLRTPQELSDGQRYRFRLAFALAHKPDWIVADEFTATLDRRLARVISSNLRRLAAKTGTGFLLATTHDDIVNDVAADHHVRASLNGTIERQSPADAEDQEPSSLKKKCLASPENAGFPPAPSPIGRTSLGGIIAATTSG